MRSVVMVLGLALASGAWPGAVEGQSPAPGATPPPAQRVSWICEDAFARAASTPAAMPDPGAPAVAPAVPVTAVSAAPPDPALDDAIRACASLEEWMAAAAAHPEALGGSDPVAHLAQRCADETAGLGRYATCDSLERAAVSPAASPVPARPPTAVDGGGNVGGATPRTAPTRDRRPPDPSRAAAEPRLARLPREMRAPIAVATSIRYFPIRGTSAAELLRQIDRKAARFCGRHAAACVRTQPRVSARTRTDLRTGACRIVSVSTGLTSTVHMPRWTSPSRVPPDVLAWWRTVFRRIAWHEGQHIRIARRSLDELPSRLVGRSCSSFRSSFRRWGRALERKQDAFDARDAGRPWPAYRGSSG